MRLGVFLPNWVGDVVMATPALRALREHVGAGQVIGIMRPYVAEVLAGSAWFDETIVYAKAGWTGRLSDQATAGDVSPSRGLVARLRAARLDVAVLLTNSLRTGWLAFRSG